MTGRPAGEDQPASTVLPGWFGALLVCTAVLLTAYSVVAVAAALLGQFRPAPVLAATTVASVGLAALLARRHPADRRGPGTADRSTIRCSVLAVAVAATSVLVNASHSAEHVFVDSDPGVYLVTARWLTDQGGLLVDPDRSAFGDLPGLSYEGSGFADAPDGRLYPQFLHLLPAILAGSGWLAGSGAVYKANAVVGGLVLLALFAVAARFLRPAWALLLTVGMAATPLHAYFARDAYSEPLSLLALLLGLYLLGRSVDRGAPAWYFVSGLALGLPCMVRVDAWVFLVSYVLAAAWYLLQPDPPPPAGMRRRGVVVLLGLGVVGPLAVGVLDAWWASRAYLEVLRAHVLGIAAVVALTIVVVAWLSTGRRRPSTMHVAAQLRGNVATVTAVAGGAVLLLAGYALTLRPAMERPRGLVAPSAAAVAGAQRHESLPVDPQRMYGELSLRWLVWYLGITVVVLGMAGAVLLLRRALRTADPVAVVLCLLFSSFTLLYLARPSITPIHPFAMRRYLPVTVPVLLLTAGLSLSAWWGFAGSRRRRTAHRLAVLVAASLVVLGPLTSVPLLLWQRTQVPLRSVVGELCAQIGANSVIVLPAADGLTGQVSMTLRAYCGRPTAVVPVGSPPRLYEQLAAVAADDGRRAYVVVSNPAHLPARAVVQATIPARWRTVRPSVGHAPDEELHQRLDIRVATLAPPTD